MADDGIGVSVKRKEDQRFLTGAGTYTSDIDRPGQAHAYFVRSPHAHAKIKAIAKDAALAMPGVVAVLTGDDVAADGLGGIPCGFLPAPGPMNEPPRPALAHGTVRFVGDALAVVIAESIAQAKDAAARIEVDYDVLQAVVLAVDALKASAPQLHAEAAQNINFEWELGDQAATDAAFAKARHVTKLDLINSRLIPNAIEPRAAIGEYNAGTGGYTLYTTSQNPHLTRLLLAAFVMQIPESKLRVVAPDVGGGFGSKIPHYPEEAVVTWASRKVGRPVKWTAERSESFLTDAHGRDHVTQAELALDENGTFLGLRVHSTVNMGAYISTLGPLVPTYLYATLLAGQYTTPAIHCSVTSVFTNTAPVDALRGAGRPEATYLLERLVENAAREMVGWQ